jgi:hypothetical protein
LLLDLLLPLQWVQAGQQIKITVQLVRLVLFLLLAEVVVPIDLLLLVVGEVAAEVLGILLLTLQSVAMA